MVSLEVCFDYTPRGRLSLLDEQTGWWPDSRRPFGQVRHTASQRWNDSLEAAQPCSMKEPWHSHG